MLQQTVSHYFPWTDSDDVAVCGRYLTAADVHSPSPTCPTCAARLAEEDALEALIELEQLPLDAEEAHIALDPILNAGVPDLFAFAVALTRSHAAAVRRVA